MNVLPHSKNRSQLIAEEEVVSKPGAKVTVVRLRLTDTGREALTTGSTGIKSGALQVSGPIKPRKELSPV